MMANTIKRGPRGAYDEYVTHYISCADGVPRVYRSHVAIDALPRKERAYLAMRRAEINWRTGSPSYGWARQLYIHYVFGGK